MTPNPTLHASRLAGAVWGHLVGDAVGVPYEFGPARAAESVVFGATGGPWNQPAGTWSDDGALMLALIDSLVGGARGTLDQPVLDVEDQGRRALGWRRDGAYAPGRVVFDIGNATRVALDALEAGAPALDAGPTDERACGNGSLMRILPIGLVGPAWSPRERVVAAHAASRVTHGHPRCQVACAVYVLIVAALVGGMEPAAALAWAFAESGRLYEEERGYEEHAAALEELRAYPERTGSGYVLNAFWSAWDAFASADSYADTIRRAVAYGHDTDTTAAIAGGMAGTSFGWEAIPRDWLRGMRGKEIAQPLVDTLVEGAGCRTSTFSPLRLDELPLGGTSVAGSGRVAMTFLPGKKRDGCSGLHWRDLDLDHARLADAGVDALLLLNEDEELVRALVADLPEVFAAGGKPELIRFPIPDPHVPDDLGAYRACVRDVADRVRAGQFVVIACRGGIDRTGMTAACLLREAGLAFGPAIARVQAARPHTITIGAQQAIVRDW